MSTERASLSDGREYRPPDVAALLRAAEISPSKLGPARHTRLTDSERALYFWILRRFATSSRPSDAETRAAAEQFGLDVEGALERFAREDLVQVDRKGEIGVAYPFAGRPTAHHVRFQSGHEAYAMCAIDALGIAPMFDEPIEIASRDPLTEKEIQVELAPDGMGSWQPQEAVVVLRRERERRVLPQLLSCAQLLRLQGERRALAASAPRVHGQVISIPEAIAAGRSVFGDVLEPR